jgi:hypothetical protein
MYRKLILMCMALVAVLGFFQTCSFAADEEPPKNRLVFSKKFENIVDNSWSNLEFPEDEQPPGLYYIELTELEGTVGCWGSQNNPYEDGPNGELLIAWRDEEPMEGNTDSDFRLQYRPTMNAWVELIVIAPQGAIGNDWYPFGLQDATESIGQTFIAPEKFTGVGLHTPTWVTNNSGCTISLYSAGGATPKAYGPTPKNGALIADTWVSLSWRALNFAVSHDVYLSDNFDDVSNGAESAFQGNQIDTFIVAGFPGFPFPDGLVPGTTYYWRIDEVNDAEPNSPWIGDVWSFSVPPKAAYFPDPANGAESVSVDGILRFTPGFGAKLHTVYFGETFDEVDNAAGGSPQGMTTYTPGTLKMARTYYWRVDEFDSVETYKGNIWSFTTEGGVGSPDPANGTVDVTQTLTLTWVPGVFAASHQVYFGSDAEAVKNADTSSAEYKGTRDLGSESFDTGNLEWNTTYYWRIDEVNNANADSPWTGPLWSFTTANFLIIDDFEAYNDLDPTDPASNRIYISWVDGYDDPTNGSLVGYENPPFAEQTIVHSGNQSMPMSYDNAVGKSEATLTLTSNRDWTVKGVNTLTIWFRGEAGNAAEQMYVTLNGNARIDHDDPDAVTAISWTEWNIDLTRFADQGVNLANVNSITLGLSSVTGGTGMMYFDDIRLYAPAP